MNKIFKVVKNQIFIFILILSVLIILTFILGSFLHLPKLYLYAISIFILMVFVIILLYIRMKEVQKAAQIEQQISMQADDQMQYLSPEKRAEIEQFKKQLEAAINSLKNSKLGKGKFGKAALYALPWYMFIGPPAAGKTTAIQNSGLDFPFGKDSFRGVGGTRNCDWFFSTKGIFLDTAGRYMTQTEDKPEWIAFLNTLKKNRKRKPINGVIVSINIDEIVNSEKDKLYDHARNIRQKIDELIENLEINFPIYLIFTKCDLIQGFVEFFSDFSETERSQIWGATLIPQQQFSSSPKDLFEKEFEKLSGKLFDVRTIRLSGPLKREQRRKVFLFPFQFQSLQSKLSYLIGEIFQPNPYQDNPIFRGFYFSSGTQEGIPLDLAIREIAKQFNLPESTDSESIPVYETKNYFIKDVLNEVVIGDQNFSAGQTTNVVKKNTFLKTASISFSTIILILFSLFIFFGYKGSSSSLDDIVKTANLFNSINWDGDLLNTFKGTDSLRSLIFKVQNGTADESYIHFGLDRTDETYKPLVKLFFSKSENFFKQNIFDNIAQNLNNYANGQNYSGEDIYNYLKSYLLLGDERARFDTTQYRFLSHEFSGILESRYLSLNLSASQKDKDSLQHFFRNYSSFVAGHLSDKNVYQVKNDNLLINLVRNRIQYKPNAETIYARLKQNGIGQFPAELTLEQAIGGRFLNIMSTDQKIPYIFTNEGWRTYFKNAINDESINPEKDDWVIGKRNIQPAENNNFNPLEMKNNLLNLYCSDYKQSWLQFLQSIKYNNFGSVPLAANNLKLLSDPVNSPVILLLKIFSDQLQVIADIQKQDSINIKSNNNITPISLNNSTFSEVNKYRTFSTGSANNAPSNDLNAIVGQYAVLSSVLAPISGGQDLAKDYAVKVLTQRAVEFPTAVQVIRGAIFNAPDLENFFISPVILAWQSILSDAGQYLNLEWKTKISDPFNKALANSFPFKSQGNDAPLQDFKDFLNLPTEFYGHSLIPS